MSRPGATDGLGRSSPESETPEPQTLVEAIVDLLAPRVAALAGASSLRPFVGVAEAAAFLGVQESWLASRARNGEAPCRRMGKYVRFDLVELRAWIDATAAFGPGAGIGPVSSAVEAERSSTISSQFGAEVPSVVPSERERRAA